MQAVHTRQSLMTRIGETQRRAALVRDERRAPRRQKPSFTERYRGTEFETLGTLIVPTQAREPLMSRGRLFVMVTGVAAMGMFGLIVNAALSA